MLYVGLTESHNESASLFANLVGAQVISQLLELNSSTEVAAYNISGICCHVRYYIRNELNYSPCTLLSEGGIIED